MIAGSCLCGKVKFEISGEPFSLSHCHCHCSRRRKAAGVFSSVLIGEADDLAVTQGHDAIGAFRAATDAKFARCLCKDCGTSPGDMAGGDVYAIAASDDDPKIHPALHIHTASKPDWYEVVDDLAKFEGDHVPPA
jgi:hypothetical protein